jgi:NDP-sugar pyrophosphorylase family protein
MLPVVILCGGFGTRLRPITEDVPKPLVPVGGSPFLARVLEQVQEDGVNEVILSTGYLAEQVESFVQNTSWDFSLECIREDEPLGTGGSLRFVAEKAGLDAFIALNGDTLFGGSLNRLVNEHLERDEPAASIALARTDEADRYGQVRFDSDNGEIIKFEEKNSDTEGDVWINAGAYVLEPELWSSIDGKGKVSLEHEVFPDWVGEGLYGCPFPEARFIDIGTPEDYRKAKSKLGEA